MSIRLTLPIPISLNEAYATVGKRRVKTQPYRRWLGQVANYLLVQKRIYSPISGPYILRIILPQKMRGDCDNRIKPISDALVKYGVTSDDRYCQKASAERDPTVPPDMCRVEIVGVA